jgi:hypothetical protein
MQQMVIPLQHVAEEIAIFRPTNKSAQGQFAANSYFGWHRSRSASMAANFVAPAYYEHAAIQQIHPSFVSGPRVRVG